MNNPHPAGQSDTPFSLQPYQQRLLEQLELRLPATQASVPALRQAMRYASLQGGKRLRAALVYVTGESLGAALPDLDAPACAVECVHAYSLIHDDLPAMDDDDLRRGQPSCHMAYGEAIAILAGDALNSLAFEILASPETKACSNAHRCRMIHCLAMASGENGMAGGQTLDINATGSQLTLQELQAMHRLKTGALFRASVQLGALAADCSNAQDLKTLDQFAGAIGLAFQVIDDILDATVSTATLGKHSGSDTLNNKVTYVSLLGLQRAQQTAAELYEFALECLSSLRHNTDRLAALADLIVHRTN